MSCKQEKKATYITLHKSLQYHYHTIASTMFMSLEDTLQQIPVLQDDIDSIEQPYGLLTDTAIRHLTYHTVFEDSQPPSTVNFVDPSWLSGWEQGGFHKPEQDPSFFLPTPKGIVTGLAIPYNLGNDHWTTIAVDLVGSKAIFFNSFRCEGDTARAKMVMERFFWEFEEEFDSGTFLFEEADDCPQQVDGSSCGLYTVRILCHLIEDQPPILNALSSADKEYFREKGTEILKYAAAMQADGSR